MKYRFRKFTTFLPNLIWVVFVFTACRGQPSENPPFHLNPNMDFQHRYDPQEASPLFADGRAMRPLIAGVVPHDAAKDDDAFYRGKKDGKYIETFPIEVTKDLVKRGERRFNVYCQPCHGPLGNGQGMVAKHGFAAVTNLHDERLRTMPPGEIFNTISNGLRNMPAYNTQIDEQDRWAIIAYLRALQLSQNVKMSELSTEEQNKVMAHHANKHE